MTLQELGEYPEIESFVYFVFEENGYEATEDALEDFLVDREPCVVCGESLVYCDDGDTCNHCLRDVMVD